MTVTVTTNKIQYTGDGVQADFVYPFRIFENSDLEVFVDTTLQVLNTDYTVFGAGDLGGGYINFAPTVPADQTTVTINRAIPQTQLIDYVDYDRFPAETHESGLDKLTILIQQVQEELDRAVKYAVPQQPEDPFTVSFGSAAERANKIWAFDSTGNIVIVIDAAEDKAYRWAEEDEDEVVEFRDGRNRYSAYHWAQKAETVVGLPFTQVGDLLTGAGPGWGTATILGVGTDGQVLVVDPVAFPATTIGWKTIPEQLPPLLQDGTEKLKILQVKVDETGYELTEQYSNLFYHGEEFLDDDETTPGIVNAPTISHYKNVARQFEVEDSRCWLNDVVVRRHDVLTYSLRLRIARDVPQAGTGNFCKFEASAYLYVTGATLNPTPITVTMAFDQAIKSDPAFAEDFIIPDLIPAGYVAGETDVLAAISVTRITPGSLPYTGPVDLIVAILESD